MFSTALKMKHALIEKWLLTSRKDTKENEDCDRLRWLTEQRRLANDQCNMCDAASHASIYDAEPSDFTKRQMKKNHARQIYFHRSNFYFYRKSVNYLFQWKIIQRNCNFTRPVFRMKRGPSSLNLRYAWER